MEKFTDIFGCVFSASGTRGFYGEEYWYHKLYQKLFKKGFNFSGAVSIVKTITVSRRMPQTEDELGKGNGNIILDSETWLPKQRFPDCIKVGLRGFLTGTIHNSVGWANPGLKALLKRLLKLKLEGKLEDRLILSIGSAQLTKKSDCENIVKPRIWLRNG